MVGHVIGDVVGDVTDGQYDEICGNFSEIALPSKVKRSILNIEILNTRLQLSVFSISTFLHILNI